MSPTVPLRAAVQEDEGRVPPMDQVPGKAAAARGSGSAEGLPGMVG